MSFDGESMGMRPVPDKKMINRRDFLKRAVVVAGGVVAAPVVAGAVGGLMSGEKPIRNPERLAAVFEGHKEKDMPPEFPTHPDEVKKLFQPVVLKKGTPVPLNGTSVVIQHKAAELHIVFTPKETGSGASITKPGGTDVLFVIPDNESMALQTDTESPEGTPVAVLDLSPFQDKNGKIPRSIATGLGAAFADGGLWKETGVESAPSHPEIEVMLVESDRNNSMDKPKAVRHDEKGMEFEAQAFMNQATVTQSLNDTIMTHKAFS